MTLGKLLNPFPFLKKKKILLLQTGIKPLSAPLSALRNFADEIKEVERLTQKTACTWGLLIFNYLPRKFLCLLSLLIAIIR